LGGGHLEDAHEVFHEVGGVADAGAVASVADGELGNGRAREALTLEGGEGLADAFKDAWGFAKEVDVCLVAVQEVREGHTAAVPASLAAFLQHVGEGEAELLDAPQLVLPSRIAVARLVPTEFKKLHHVVRGLCGRWRTCLSSPVRTGART